MKTILSLALALALSACGGQKDDQTVIVPQGKTMADVKADYLQCQFEAVRAAPNQAFDHNPFGMGYARAEIGNACIMAKGYTGVPRNGGPAVIFQ